MVSFDSKAYSKKLLHLISWSHWFTFFNIIAAILLSSVYLINEVSPTTVTGTIYLVTNWLSHMAFLTFITFVLTVFPLTLIFPRTRFIRASASIIFTIVLLLLLLDAFIFNRLGYHINASSNSQIIDLIAQEIQQDRRMFWFSSLILCLLILTFELVVSNYAWKHLKSLQKTVFARYTVFGLVACFFTSHIMHIIADANLNYDILKQDTVLPVSYPTTAKTLLTKYGLFNQADYLERKTSPLSFSKDIPTYPVIEQQCKGVINKQSVFMVLTKNGLTERQMNQFSQRSDAQTINLTHHIDNALFNDAWFNLLYGLPTIYKQGIVEQQSVPPILMQAIKQQGLSTSLAVISQNVQSIDIPWLSQLFDQQHTINNIADFIFSNKLNDMDTGLHVIYFDDEDSYQFEVFMDALLLGQRYRDAKDIIWISSIGNADQISGLSIKPALLLWPEKRERTISHLTSQMDVSSTLTRHWLNCGKTYQPYTNGTSLLKLKKDRVIANTMTNGIMVFNKDKSVLIDQNGNFQSYSRQLQAPISESSDFPLMIDGVHFIKKFSDLAETEQ
ncbi:DUF3413 domain-containing protein [Thalassotalea atypica]|uniref:DUF3413 domain-containing protein n=1 Tax=Thalassotalea atypica TaxID=2054316 RepID=UPI002573C7B3|nr:DUF3413 domain-containing protein [Thalassotalea atypica]